MQASLKSLVLDPNALISFATDRGPVQQAGIGAIIGKAVRAEARSVRRTGAVGCYALAFGAMLLMVLNLVLVVASTTRSHGRRRRDCPSGGLGSSS
jgi:hypothetical protein